MTEKSALEDLREIRKMMEQSSKFLSLSGLSGIMAGLCGLIGSWLAISELQHYEQMYLTNYMSGTLRQAEYNLIYHLAIIAIMVLILAFGFGFFFTWIKSRKTGQSLFSPLSIRLVISLMVPLIFGGLFVLIGLYKGYYEIAAPATLIFYGLALLNASKYVHADIKILAVAEMILGLLAFATLEYTSAGALRLIYFWAIGFGILHIIYGTIIYFRYDYQKKK
ncbi:MAG: hypothetical protein IPM74_00375 [Crocinitomicaceae bacterium]|nr:hypothetical protein [Crocinitomicaceae bacterium]MBK8924373.1 hypothetical protein [Crocinitomicaceae bacterium]